jgi:LacI family transcriptional regulator
MNVTLKEIALLANVSTKTVSRVINNDPLVGEITRKKISKLIKDSGYRPNFVARSLKTKKSNSIGVIVPDIGDPSFIEIVKGCTDVFDKNNYFVYLCSSENNSEKEISFIKDFEHMFVEGIALIPSYTENRDIAFLKKMHTPIVLIDREIDGFDIDRVILSNKKGTYDAINLLISKGHENIVFLGGIKEAKTAQKRFEGYQKAMSKTGLYKKELIFWNDFTIDGGYSLMSNALQRLEKIDAVFACNDLIALGAMNAIKDHDLNIPEDISIVGFNDTFFSKFLNPPLSSVKVSFYDEGKIAAELLMERIKKTNSSKNKEVRRIVLDSELIVRKSIKL